MSKMTRRISSVKQGEVEMCFYAIILEMENIGNQYTKLILPQIIRYDSATPIVLEQI